jgi:hypothetical protein
MHDPGIKTLSYQSIIYFYNTFSFKLRVFDTSSTRSITKNPGNNQDNRIKNVRTSLSTRTNTCRSNKIPEETLIG